jgi:hypothetical protein
VIDYSGGICEGNVAACFKVLYFIFPERLKETKGSFTGDCSSQFSRCSDGLLVGWPAFDSWQGQESFLYSTAAVGPTQHPIKLVAGALSPGVKRPGRESDHSPPSSANVKNGGAILPSPYMFS